MFQTRYDRHQATLQDITAAWDRCHPHLRPLKRRLPLAQGDSVPLPDGGRGIAVLAYLRYGAARWSDVPQQIIYDEARDRFFCEGGDAVTAVNARLWFSTPTFLNLEPTTRCNFNCWYCVGRHMKQEDLRIEDFCKVLDHFPNLRTLALVGEGEPLLHKGFFTMAQLARDRGIKVMTISNGSTLSRSVVRKLCEVGVSYVAISIDSDDPAQFGRSRINGKLEQIWAGIERLRRYRDEHGYRYPKIALKGTLFTETERDLPSIVAAAKAHGVEIFESFQPLNPMQTYVGIYPKDKLPELEHVDRIAARITEDSARAAHGLKPLRTFCMEEGIDLVKDSIHKPLRKNCDEQWIYSLQSGDVTPCCQIKTPVNPRWNLFEQTLDSILSDPEYENTRFNLWNGLFPTYCQGCWKTRGTLQVSERLCRRDAT